MTNNYTYTPLSANQSTTNIHLKHLFTSHSPLYSLRSIVPITHYCRLPGNRLFTFKFELPAMLDLVELKTGIYLRIPNDFIYSSQVDVLSLSHDLPLISNTDLSWLYRLRDMTKISPPSRSPYHSHCRINHINDSNIILNNDFIHLPLYFSSDANLHIYNLNSLKISFSILLPSTILTSECFTLLTDYITIEEDKYNDFSNCLNVLLDRTTPPAIKTIIISHLAKYNISHGRNICSPSSISLTQYYDDNGSLIKPLPDSYNLKHRTIFNIWRKHGIHQIMTYLRSIQDEAFQAALSRFNDLQHR